MIGTSGAGTTFESRAVACLLAALLGEAAALGDGAGLVIENIELQRSGAVAGFDDAIVRHRLPGGGTRATVIQIKRTLSGERSDPAFKRPIAEAARHIRANPADTHRFRIVTGQSGFGPRDAERTALAARLSLSSEDFWHRWAEPAAANAGERAFAEAVAWVIEDEFDCPDPSLAWELLKRFSLIVADIEEAGSLHEHWALRNLERALSDPASASDLLRELEHIAADAARVAGALDRSILALELADRFSLSASEHLAPCLARLDREAELALASIRDDILGFRLPRADPTTQLSRQLAEGKNIRLGGAAGSGKSAILKRLAEEAADRGHGRIVLKHDRLSAATWSAYGASLQLSTDLPELIEALAVSGEALLVIDGLDRIQDSQSVGILNDLLAAIARSPTAARWRFLVSSRDMAGPDVAALANLPDLLRFAVNAPVPGELRLLGERFPHLQTMLTRQGYGELNRNLFFIAQIAARPSQAGASSELDLMQAWATRGSVASPPDPHRDTALRTLARARLGQPFGGLPKGGIALGLTALVSEGTLAEPPYRDVVHFTHDIYEDWAIARALDAQRSALPSLLKSARQPLAWLRAVRLVAEIAVDAEGAAAWRTLHAQLRDDPDLDPVWARQVLVAPLASPRAHTLLDRIEPELLADNAALMREIADTLTSFELQPHPEILAGTAYPEADAVTRAALAQRHQVPRWPTWPAFMSWSVERWPTWPQSLAPILSRLTLFWLRRPVHRWQISRHAVVQVGQWLAAADAAEELSWDQREERDRCLAELGLDDDDRDPAAFLRLVVTHGSDAAPDVARTYLERLLTTCIRHAESVVVSPGILPRLEPGLFADLVAQTMIDERCDEPFDTDLAITHGYGLRDTAGLFPSAPGRAGFDALFATDEDAALGLLGQFCRVASKQWCLKQQQRGLTPRPIRLELPDGSIELWGDQHVFKWSRGVLGPHILTSLLLATDQWLAAQVASGRPLAEMVAKTLRAGPLVAIAGPVIAAGIDRNKVRADLTVMLPLMCSPRLWFYDLARWMEDERATAYGIGWTPGDEDNRADVMALLERRRRQPPLLQGLVAQLHVFGDEASKAAFAAAAANWQIADLADFEEALEDEDGELAERLKTYRSQADPDNWQLQVAEDRSWFAMHYVVPEHLQARAAEVGERQQALNATNPLLDWSFGRSRGIVSTDGTPITDAIPLAISLDCPQLFDSMSFDLELIMRAQAVAAIAASLLAGGDDALLAEHRAWARSVVARAASLDPWTTGIHYEETTMADDPLANAGRGLAALVGRGIAEPHETELWLRLVSSPFRDVAKASIEGIAPFAEHRPLAAAAGLTALADSFLFSWRQWGADLEQWLRDDRAARAERAVVAIADRLTNNDVANMPVPPPIPAPFVAASQSFYPHGDVDWQFDTYRAASILRQFDLSPFLAVPDLRERLCRFAHAAIEWLRSFVDGQQPPKGSWDTDDRRMDWEQSLGALMGQIAYSVPPERAIADLLRPIAAIESEETRMTVLEAFLNAHATRLFNSNKPVDEAFAAVWRAGVSIVFDGLKAQHEYRRSEALAAAGFCCYNWPVFEPNWPHAASFAPLIAEWVEACAAFEVAPPVVSALVAQAPAAFSPDPALGWLEQIMTAHIASDLRERLRSGAGRRCGQLLATIWSATSASDRLAAVQRFRRLASQLADFGAPEAVALLPEIAEVQARG
ncbi:ATP-binding protein [Rhodopseudomonas palustris]|uniref:ATP-binding protein n=1 Tax=Rhodopseudomonas palustris TaxID=1076 RepID=UPI00115D1A52|nr:ATP-binding protein [Rhodopseudomonas palustris]QDL96682.1 ATP-binding protein [Rhodopseudomonas palustris]